MTKRKVDEISTSEWELMRVVWSKKQVTTRQLIDILQLKKDWSDSTIKTLLARLVKKGLLVNQDNLKPAVFTATIAEQAAMNQASMTLFDHLCAMKKGQTIHQLIAHNEFSKSDLEALQNLISEKLQTAPQIISCDCLPNHCEHTEG